MSAVAEMIREVRGLTDEIALVKKTVQGLTTQRTAESEAIRKAFMDARGGNNHAALISSAGDDGATLNLLNIANPRQKSIGPSFGRFLYDVNAGCLGKDPVAIEKAMARHGAKPVQKTALAEGSGTTGGYTVPVQFYADLLRLIAEESFVRSRCTTVPMQSRTLLVPGLLQSAVPTSGTSAFFGGISASWQPEAATYNETEPSFRQIELIARDLVFISVASNQLLQDNAVALDTLLTTLFKEAMAWFVDYYILRGNGAGQPLGLLNAPALYTQAGGASSTFVLSDAANMMSHLLMSSWKNAIWMMHQSVLPQLITMQANSSGTSSPLAWFSSAPGQSNEGGAALPMPATLFGLPIYFTEKLPALGTKGCVVLADLSKVLVGDRLQLQIDSSPYPRFTQNQMMWRVIARWDAQPWLDAPVTLADGTFQVSPYIAIKAAA